MRSVAGPHIVTLMNATRVRTFDVVLATVVAAALVVVMPVIENPDARSFDALAVVLVVVAGGTLALHRRAPLVVLAVTTSALVMYSLRDYSGSPVYVTWIGAIFAVSVARGPGRAWVPVAVSTAAILATADHDSTGAVVGRLSQAPWSIAALFVTWAVVALLLGGSVRGRRAERAVMGERARHLAETREEEARRWVAEERVRIARDLHDSVAHSMASISVQAGVGAYVLDERPEDARAALLSHQARQRRCAGRAAGDAGHAPLQRGRAPRADGEARPAALAGRELAPRGLRSTS
jgi:signal transduction histidine kinase